MQQKTEGSGVFYDQRSQDLVEKLYNDFCMSVDFVFSLSLLLLRRIPKHFFFVWNDLFVWVVFPLGLPVCPGTFSDRSSFLFSTVFRRDSFSVDRRRLVRYFRRNHHSVNHPENGDVREAVFELCTYCAESFFSFFFATQCASK
jgi:hypothetical protein